MPDAKDYLGRNGIGLPPGVGHGTAAALIVFVLVQVIAVLGRLDRGDGISIVSIVFTGFLAAAAGAGGGTLGARRPIDPNLP